MVHGIRPVPALDREGTVPGFDAFWSIGSDGAAAGDHRPTKRRVHRVRGSRGYDSADKLVERKRAALIDAEGQVLALAVVPPNMQDRGTLSALDDREEHWPSLRLAILDGAFTVGRYQEQCNTHGMRHRVVERTFGWLSHWGRPPRERVGDLDATPVVSPA